MVRKVVKSEPNEFATPWMHEERKVFLDLPMVITVTNKRVQEFESKNWGKHLRVRAFGFSFQKKKLKLERLTFVNYLSVVCGDLKDTTLLSLNST